MLQNVLIQCECFLNGGSLLGDLSVASRHRPRVCFLAVPQARRIGVLWNRTTPSHAPALKAIEAGAEKLGVKLGIVPAQTRDDFPVAFAAMVEERADAVSPLARVERNLLAELELKHRLPVMFGSRWNVGVGGLMSYAADLDDLTRRAAVYIDKILKGTNPADLPIEPTSPSSRRPNTSWSSTSRPPRP